MNLQVKAYVVLVAVIMLTAAVHMVLENIEKGNPEKAGRILSGFLGVVIVLAGILKLFDPYASIFAELTSLSMSSLAGFAKWAGPLSEIAVGGFLLLFLFWSKSLSYKIANSAFISVNLALIVIMTVALAVHLQYDVPANLLPFDCKFPVISVVIMAFAARNIRIRHKITQKNLKHDNILSCA